MARKSHYDRLADSISARLREMAPENGETIEEAVRNDETLSQAFGMMPTTAADYSYCPECGRIRWHEVCQMCP